MHESSPPTRRALLREARASIARGWPRVLMASIVAIAGGAGFLASVVLLRLGVEAMGARYAAAVAIAYVVFLAELGLWIWAQRNSFQPDLNPLDAVDVAADPPTPGAFDATADALPSDLDVGEGIVLVACVAIALGALVATSWVVWSAPALFAELLVDGVLATGLYRKLQRGGETAWWTGAARRTWAPALVVLVFVGVGGAVLARLVPGARTIGDVAWWLAG
jgi:hypothetical protein